MKRRSWFKSMVATLIPCFLTKNQSVRPETLRCMRWQCDHTWSVLVKQSDVFSESDWIICPKCGHGINLVQAFIHYKEHGAARDDPKPLPWKNYSFEYSNE